MALGGFRGARLLKLHESQFNSTIPPQTQNQITTIKTKMKRNLIHNGLSLLIATAALFSAVAPAQAQDKKPNILFIMGDDIGWMQPSCYHRGLMVGETPNIDRHRETKVACS